MICPEFPPWPNSTALVARAVDDTHGPDAGRATSPSACSTSRAVHFGMSSPILDRNLSLANTREVRADAGPVLRELIDYGLRAFERCSASAEGHDTPLGVLFPFLHTLEMLDGTEALLDSAASVPATLTLRAAFESLLSLLWVAADDSERRGAAYVVCDVHRRIDVSERFDPTTRKGKIVEAAIQADDVISEFSLPAAPDAAEDRTEYLAMIQQPHLAEAAAEYERLRTPTRKPRFYSFWGGPANIERLAAKLGKSAYYEILYRPWSATAHATDLSRQLTANEERAAVRRLRNGEGMTAAYSHAIALGLWAVESAIKKYRSEELRDFWGWYQQRISPAYSRLNPSPNHFPGGQ